MTIMERDRVRAALTRALELDPQHDMERAIGAVAHSLALPVEAVRDAAEAPDEVDA